MPFFLAIDAGGTKTEFLLADDTRELARARCGTIKRMRTDARTAAANLDQALATLTRATGVSMQAIARTCIGTAGESVPLVTDFLRAELGARVAGPLLLLGDCEIALDAAFPGRPGVLVLAGTGSNVAGRSAHGQLTFAGGWGPALADQGSGHRIGLAALRAAFLARDEGRSTTLFEAVFDFWKLNSGPASPLDHLVAFANTIPAPDFSLLVPLVHGCARQGDGTAAQVLRQEGEDLAHLVRLVVRRVQAASATLPEPPPDPPPIAFAGSIMENVAPVREALIASVRSEFPDIQTMPGVVDPVLGALYRARNFTADPGPHPAPLLP
jgi:N-acetylglucosamine kinase-like BadF-type ATPase